MQLKVLSKVDETVTNSDSIRNLYIKVKKNIGWGKSAGNLVYVNPNLS